MSNQAEMALAEPQTALAPMTPMGMIQLALSQNAPVEVLRDLFQLKKEVEADEARKAYNAAFNAFKAESMRIVKNTTISDGPLRGKKYADLFAVCDTLIPILSTHGLTHAWKLTKDEPQWIEVTCTIRHRCGHSELVSMGGPPDLGGAKNAIQARASTVNYLQRYTLLAATGMAATGEDRDGNAPAPKEVMPGEILQEWIDTINQAGDMEALRKAYEDAYRAAMALGDSQAEASIIAAKNKRKGALK